MHGPDGAAHVRLDHRDHSARTQMSDGLDQRRRRLWLVHQHEAADHGVDRGIEGERVHVRDATGHVTQTRLRRTPRGRAHGGRDAVDAEHVSSLADQLRGEQAHVARAAANVQDAHAAPHAGAPQGSARDVGEEGALLRQPRQLVRGMAEHVARPRSRRAPRVHSASVHVSPTRSRPKL